MIPLGYACRETWTSCRVSVREPPVRPKIWYE